MEIKFEELLERPEIINKTKSQCSLKLNYEQFRTSVAFFTRNFGNEAKCVFSEESAYIVFKEHSNILIILHKKKGYNKEEFCFENLNISVTGTNKDKLPNFFVRLYNDIITNKKVILFYILILVWIYIIVNNNIETLKMLNDALINVISIFIGTLFVFIVLFYEDDKKNDLMLENGKFDVNSENDKYVFNLSLISLTCVLISNSLTNLNVSFLLTTISIILLIICFLSITQYYLRKIKSNAINKKIIAFREEYDKENEAKRESEIEIK